MKRAKDTMVSRDECMAIIPRQRSLRQEDHDDFRLLWAI